MDKETKEMFKVLSITLGLFIFIIVVVVATVDYEERHFGHCFGLDQNNCDYQECRYAEVKSSNHKQDYLDCLEISEYRERRQR